LVATNGALSGKLTGNEERKKEKIFMEEKLEN